MVSLGFMWTVVIIAVTGVTLWLLAEFVVPALFGYVGAGVVWLVTFGHVRMEPLDGGESGLASEIGFGFVFVLVIVGYSYFYRT